VKKIVTNIILALAIVIFVAAIVFVIFLGKSTENVYIFGYKPFVIASGSMETEYMTHSVVVIEKGDFDEIKVGDVIAFRSEMIGKKLAFHRVIRQVGDSFITKGDNNPIADEQRVTRDRYVGREVFHTNWPAYYIQELARPFGFLRMIVLPVLAIVMFCLAIRLFHQWPADARLKRVVASAIWLGVSVVALLAYMWWDSSRISFINDKLAETANQFQAQTAADTTVSVNNREVIGVIEIPSVDIKYPIVEYENESSLNVSVAKYSGPMLNEIGNVVLIGHRSAGGGKLFFSRIDNLREGDNVKITDKTGQTLDFTVKSYAVHSPADLSVLKAADGNQKELTLISCSANFKDRYVVKLVAAD
jgi:signal peptidase I